jgi:predicted enzyme related to lactoylglutathione lyase
MTDSNIGRFVWYDLLTTDPEASVSFYSHVIGWKSQPFEQDYTMFTSEQGPLAGTTGLPEQAKNMGAPPHWASNVAVADADATVALAKKLGGRVFKEPTDYPKVGRLAVIGDPQGAPIHVFRPNQPMTLHDSSKPGEFVWSELLTTDHEAAFGFYSALFGWEKIRDFDMGGMGKYLIYGTRGKELGGMFTKSKDMPMPPMWTYYVQVADLDAAILRARAKGARLMNGPMEVPGGARIAQLSDPQGAAFALHEAPKAARA